MDIKEKVEEIVKKLTADKNLMAQFQKDPVKALESVLGVDLPDNVLNPIISGVQAKLGADKLSGALGALGKIIK